LSGVAFSQGARDRYLPHFFEKPKPLSAFHFVFSFERERFAFRTDGFADSPVCSLPFFGNLKRPNGILVFQFRSGSSLTKQGIRLLPLLSQRLKALPRREVRYGANQKKPDLQDRGNLKSA